MDHCTGLPAAVPSTLQVATQIAAVILLFLLYSPVARMSLSVFNQYPHGVWITENGASEAAFFLQEDMSIRIASSFHVVSCRP